MRRSKRSTDEGSATLELITAGLLLLVPIVYLVLSISAVQAATLAVDGAARQATRVFVQSDTSGHARSAAARAIDVTLADYGVDAGDATVQITCRPPANAHPESTTRLTARTVAFTASATASSCES